MNKFTMNAIIVAVIFIAEVLLKLNQGVMGFVICFVNIALVIFMYKNYADSETEKEKLTIGRGAIFGLYIGVIFAVFCLLYYFVILDEESIRQMMIDQAEKSSAFMGEEQMDASLAMYDNMSGTTLRMMMGGGSLVGAALTVVYGLIAGAIFKHKEEEN